VVDATVTRDAQTGTVIPCESQPSDQLQRLVGQGCSSSLRIVAEDEFSCEEFRRQKGPRESGG